jgi:hypothetical protein
MTAFNAEAASYNQVKLHKMLERVKELLTPEEINNMMLLIK